MITLTYDRTVDMTYLGYVREPKIVKTELYCHHINLDFNKEGIVVGIEYDGKPVKLLADPVLLDILIEHPDARELVKPFQ